MPQTVVKLSVFFVFLSSDCFYVSHRILTVQKQFYQSMFGFR